jgi:hypothetical protein
MSVFETAPLRAGGTPMTAVETGLRARLADAWPLAVIAVGGALSLAWIGALAWSVLELVIWLA